MKMVFNKAILIDAAMTVAGTAEAVGEGVAYLITGNDYYLKMAEGAALTAGISGVKVAGTYYAHRASLKRENELLTNEVGLGLNVASAVASEAIKHSGYDNKSIVGNVLTYQSMISSVANSVEGYLKRKSKKEKEKAEKPAE
jgi:hypothetical protein